MTSPKPAAEKHSESDTIMTGNSLVLKFFNSNSEYPYLKPIINVLNAIVNCGSPEEV